MNNLQAEMGKIFKDLIICVYVAKVEIVKMEENRFKIGVTFPKVLEKIVKQQIDDEIKSNVYS